MSKNVRHKSYSDTLKDKRAEKRQRQYARMRNNNECGNNEWKRVDLHTQILMCKQTGERCNMAACPCFSKQS